MPMATKTEAKWSRSSKCEHLQTSTLKDKRGCVSLLMENKIKYSKMVKGDWVSNKRHSQRHSDYPKGWFSRDKRRDAFVSLINRWMKAK